MEAAQKVTDELAMRRALELATRGAGSVSPNPLVGCVIVKDGVILSEGWHKTYGSAHAEVEAISRSQSDVAGATLVVTLEPCCHWGKTPPCADLIIQSKIARVVIGQVDPNPLVSGRGIAALREAGIEVLTGVLENECRWLTRFFSKYIQTGNPYCIAKIACSLDGCIATSSGESKWISSEESRKRVHILRAEVDAVMVGAGTAIKDDPQLTVRMMSARNPLRIVTDTNLSLPLTLRIFNDEWKEITVVACNEELQSSAKADALCDKGVRVLGSKTSGSGTLHLSTLMKKLGSELRISSLMVEGGAALLTSLAGESCIDELHCFTAPLIIGNGLRAFGDIGVRELGMASRFEVHSLNNSGGDVYTISIRTP